MTGGDKMRNEEMRHRTGLETLEVIEDQTDCSGCDMFTGWMIIGSQNKH